MTTNNHDENTTTTATPIIPKLVIDDIDNILLPIGGGSRVKYTCLDVSKRYLALGANTGSLYFFERKSQSSIFTTANNKQKLIDHFTKNQYQNSGQFKIFTNENLSFTQILSLNDIRDQISIIKINPTNDNLVAVATMKTLYIIESNISRSREKEKILAKMTDHPKDSEITSIIWSRCGQYLFSGDDSGNIYCCSVTKARKAFFFSGELVYKCDSKIVQLDIIPTIVQQQSIQQPILDKDPQQTFFNGQQSQLQPQPLLNQVITTPVQQPQIIQSINVSILSSTLTKSVVLNYQILTSTNSGKLQASIIQIGKKLRENTKQGACFHPFYKSSVYTSRPGKRLWLADPIDGKVLSTMNFTPSEDTTIIVRPKPLVSSQSPDFDQTIQGKFPMIFSKLLPYGNYLISYDEHSLLLIDVNEVEVLEWKLDQNQIHDLVVYHDSIYILHGQQRSISRIYTSIPITILPPSDEKDNQKDEINNDIDNQNQIDEQVLLQPQPIQQQQPIIQETELPIKEEEVTVTIDQKQQEQKQQEQEQQEQEQEQQHEQQKEQEQQQEQQEKQSIALESNDQEVLIKKDDENLSKNNSLSNLSESLSENDTNLTDSLSNSTEDNVKDNNIILPVTITTSNILKSSIDSDVKKDEHINNQSSDSTTSTTTINNNTNTTIEEPIKKIQKESIFSDIPLSSEPLITKEPTLTAPRKIIKKKVKVTDKDKQQQSAAPLSTSPPITTIVNKLDEPSSTTTINTEESTTGPKRTVIVKKKIVKKAPVSAPSSNVNSPPIANPISPPVDQFIQPTQQQQQQQQQQPVSIIPDTITTEQHQHQHQTASTLVQQGKEGIFKTLNSATSSFLEIKQFALSKTNEIKSDITHKILGPNGTIPTSTTTNGIINGPISIPSTSIATTTTLINEELPIQPQQPQSTPLETLENLTKKTYESLLSFKENKNKEESFEAILTIWVYLFNSIEDVPPNDMIKEIVTDCFIMGINLNQCKESNQHSNNKLCKCWNELNAREFIKSYFSFLQINRIYLNCNEKQWDSCIETLLELESFTKQESKIISTIYQFLDSNDSSTCLSLLENHSNDHGLLFRFIEPLLQLSPKESSIFFAKQYPIILPRNVFQYIKEDDSSGSLIKFEYLNQLMSSQQQQQLSSISNKNNSLLKLSSSTLLLEWFNCTLQYEKPNNNLLFLNNSVPKIGSFRVEWKFNSILLSIIENTINGQYNNGDLKYFEELSRTEGYHQGLFLIYQYYFKIYSMKSVLYNEKLLFKYSKKLIELTIYSDNKSGFIQLFETNTSIEIWSYCLEIMKHLRKLVDTEFEYYDESNKIVLDISESFIIELMGKAIGPLETIDLICNNNNNEMFEKNKISTNILSNWINFGKWSLYDRSKLSYDILSNLDSHLWLKKPLTISPQILSMLIKELNLNDQQQQQRQHSNFKNNIGQLDFNLPQFFEDNSRRHWGVETELQTGVCQICTLPLAENPESSFLGSTPATIIVFPNCGHSYHHCCIEEQTCMLCFSKK